MGSAGEDEFLDLFVYPVQHFAFNPEADTDLDHGR